MCDMQMQHTLKRRSTSIHRLVTVLGVNVSLPYIFMDCSIGQKYWHKVSLLPTVEYIGNNVNNDRKKVILHLDHDYNR